MGGSKDIQSDSSEPKKEQGANSGSFFKKYTIQIPDDDQVAPNETLFKKYVPAPSRSPDDDNQISSQVVGLSVMGPASISKSSKGRQPHYVWWGVASAILILAGWMILKVLLNIKETGNQQTYSGNSTSADRASPGANGPVNELSAVGPSASTEDESADENEGGPSKPAQSRRLAVSSPDLLYNLMLTRAREFEDRGMLSRAEEEYRAVAASFPGDSFSRAGLSRVQGVLSSRYENEKSRVSRETGLRNFRMSDYAGAQRELSAAVNAGRTDTAVLYALGMSYLKLGDYAKAQITLDRCLADSPNYAPALVGLAETRMMTGRRDQALPLLERALELGGGAEFTPAKIKDMISLLDPSQAVPSPTAPSSPSPERSKPTFSARAVHTHSFMLASCDGDLEIVNSVVHFNASNPSHSFHILASGISGAHIAGNALHFRIGGKDYRFTIKGRSARDFLDALVR